MSVTNDEWIGSWWKLAAKRINGEKMTPAQEAKWAEWQEMRRKMWEYRTSAEEMALWKPKSLNF